MQRKKALLQSHQKKRPKNLRVPSVNTKLSAGGTMSSYSQTPLLKNHKFTPRNTSENDLDLVFEGKKSILNLEASNMKKKENEEITRSVKSKKELDKIHIDAMQ